MKKVLLCFLFTFAFLQSNPLLNLAHELYRRGRWDEAITEYKRFLFFHSDSSEKALALYRIGLCYRQLGEDEKALNFFRKALSTAGKQLREEVLLSTAALLMEQNRLYNAEMLLKSVFYSTENKNTKFKSGVMLGLCYAMQYRWYHAKHIFAQILRKEKHKKLFQILEEAAKVKLKSPEKARRLSALLPGMGQIYAGFPWQGLSSLTVNLLFLYPLTYHFVHKRLLDAIVVYLPLFQRYYRGAEEKAAELVRRRNRDLLEKYVEKVFDYFKRF